MTEDEVTHDDVVAHAILLRVYAGLSSEQRVKALLAADTMALVAAIAEMRAAAYADGYRAAKAELQAEHEAAMDWKPNLNPDAPSWEELLARRGWERDPNYPGTMRAVPRPDDYQGGRWRRVIDQAQGITDRGTA